MAGPRPCPFSAQTIRKEEPGGSANGSTKNFRVPSWTPAEVLLFGGIFWGEPCFFEGKGERHQNSLLLLLSDFFGTFVKLDIQQLVHFLLQGGGCLI